MESLDVLHSCIATSTNVTDFQYNSNLNIIYSGEKLQQIKGKTLKQKEILVDISTTFKPNELTAVMGPSGTNNYVIVH